MQQFFKKENIVDSFIITWKLQNTYKFLEKCNLHKQTQEDMENFSILWIITRIEYSFIIETLSKLGIKGNFFNPVKCILNFFNPINKALIIHRWYISVFGKHWRTKINWVLESFLEAQSLLRSYISIHQ